jgi:hypothetical protein
MSVLDRLLQMLVQRHVNNLPPVPQPRPVPHITTTSTDERRMIDQRLSGVKSRIAVLLAEAGLDERRSRDKGTQSSAQ